VGCYRSLQQVAEYRNLSIRRDVWRAISTGAAERQDPDFLIGPRNKKNRKKKLSNIKILHPPVQITSQGF
jgi:hypothetical protein